MIPLIIESDNQEQISAYLSDKYLLQNAVAEVRPDGNSISLEAIKYLIDRAKFCPGQKVAAYIIYDGHLITPAGQNALLKTLEESKGSEQFIITTHNRHLLLETIVSRCQVVSLVKEKHEETSSDFLKDFIRYLTGIGECFGGTDTILGDNPKKFLRRLIDNLQTANRHFPTRKRTKIIFLALSCLSDLERNINPRLAIDHFMLDCRKTIQ